MKREKKQGMRCLTLKRGVYASSKEDLDNLLIQPQ
jgi:hypothetical protein